MSDYMIPDILAIQMPGMAELLVIAFIGLLLFGKRLPQVARSIGKSIVEFKKGVRDMKDEVNDATSAADPDHMLEARPRPPLADHKAASQRPADAGKTSVNSGESSI